MNRPPARGRSRSAVPVVVGALTALGVLLGWSVAGGGPRPAAAAQTVTPTFVRVSQDAAVTEPNCANPPPLPGGAGSFTTTTTSPSSTVTATWSVPAQITAGAKATLRLQVQAVPGQLASGYMVIKGPFEFGAAPGPFELSGATAPGGSYDQSLDITFTPTRAFTPGETFFLLVGNGCTGYRYEYKATGAAAPTTPAGPRLTPRSVRPVPGVTTSYASPRRGRILALPFPKTGCDPPATTNARETATPVGGECSVDIFLRRKDGGTIDDPDAAFGTDLEVTDANLDKAFHVCKILGVVGDDFLVRAQSFGRCVLVVARILQRRDDLRTRRGQTPLERTSHAVRPCRSETIRLAGARRRASPVLVTCRRTAKGMRITVRSARKGKAVGALIKPSSKLIVGRSTRVPFRAGDRVDVLWTITPPRTTTTIRTPAPIGPSATSKIALTSVEAFPNQRASNDLPGNAIDGNTATFTWSTEAYNVTHPSYLAVGFAEANVARLRLWKERNGGGGELVKNLTIQYTTGTGPLSARTWSNVAGLANGFGGGELLRASAVNAAGTVTGDIHDSPTGDGHASLTFTSVRATGLRIGFANPNPASTCSAVPGTCNHYRVGELEAYALP